MHKGVVALGIERKKLLVEQHVDRPLPGALDHEVGARFAEDRRRVINELTCVGFNPQTDRR